MASPPVSVVLCTRDRPHLLGDALRAVGDAMGDGDEAIVVDSASRTDESARLARHAGFTVVRMHHPGLSRARNAGVAAGSSPIVAFTDDDCLPDRAWLDAIRAGFADPRNAVVMGRVVAHAAPADDPGPLPFAFGASAAVHTLGAGANMAIRRDALDAIGGFDESLGAGTSLRSGEDHDAIWRLLRAGWTGAYRPDAIVVHRDWRAPWAGVAMRYGYGLGAGAVAAKVTKVDPHTGRRLLLRRGWHDGLRQAAVDVGRGYQRAAIGDVLFTLGVGVGALHVWRRPLTSGMLRSP